jgi:hypothetical protein
MPMKRVTGAGLREGERATGVGRWSMLLALSLVLCAGAAQAQNQAAGRVEFARGVGYAQTPGAGAAHPGQGAGVPRRRHAQHLAGASAIIRMQDGTRMTLRPGTDLVIEAYRFKEDAPDNNMLLSLFAGGLRAHHRADLQERAAGRASCRPGRPPSASAAPISMRGMCQGDCAGRVGRDYRRSRVPTRCRPAPSWWRALGLIDAIDAAGQRRRLVDGGAVYPGETVETSPRRARPAGVSRRQPPDAGLRHAVQGRQLRVRREEPAEGSASWYRCCAGRCAR